MLTIEVTCKGEKHKRWKGEMKSDLKMLGDIYKLYRINRRGDYK